MNSTMLQNPSHPDATYREKAGNWYIGYAANFEESVGENGSVITDHDFEPSDKKFIQDNISRKERIEEKSTMIVDGGGYSSVEVSIEEKRKTSQRI